MLSKLSKFLKFLPLVLVVVGSVVICLTGLRHIPDFVRGITRSVSHPASYAFPAYDKLLKTYAKDGLVDYAGCKSSKELPEAVNELEGVACDKMERKDRLAYWLNAYNLLTIKMISDRYPIRTLRQVQLDRTAIKYIVGGQSMSLQTIYNQYLMPMVNDRRAIPETAFLICNGTMSYPPITGRAITADQLDTDARVACFKFINDESNVWWDADARHFYVSPVFRRYETVLANIKRTPHEFAATYILNEKKRPPVGHLMLMQTFFQKVDNTINDTALVRRKASDE